MPEIDRTDRRLLAALQTNALMTQAELGAALNLSPSQAGRRRQALEDAGILRGARALVAPEALGLTVEAFIRIELAAHSRKQAAAFEALLKRQPEIIGCWTMTGQTDYLVRVMTEGLAGLNRLVQQVLLDHEAVARVQSQIVMNQVKGDTPLPTGA